MAFVASNWTSPPSLGVIAAAAAAGAGEAIAVTALYYRLATGTMGVVAAVSALSPVLPIVIGTVSGARPAPLQAIGMVAAVGGVICISRSRSHQTTSVATGSGLTSVTFGLLAAGGFGVFLVGVGFASTDSVPWALTVARASSVTLLAATATVLRSRVRICRRDIPGLTALGVLVMAADLLYAMAATQGSLAVVAVLASVYPVVTIALARLRVREQLTLHQALGAGLCLAGVAAISAA